MKHPNSKGSSGTFGREKKKKEANPKSGKLYKFHQQEIYCCQRVLAHRYHCTKMKAKPSEGSENPRVLMSLLF